VDIGKSPSKIPVHPRRDVSASRISPPRRLHLYRRAPRLARVAAPASGGALPVGAFAMQAPTAEDEEVVFEFGDAGGVSAATDAAIEEEVELTEQQKENARLRAAEKFMMRDTGNARCTVCSYKYSMEEGAPGTAPRNTPFELLSEKWACPSCGSPKPFFEAEQIEIAGFAENQAYGFGTNTMTEAGKSNLIFGGLGACFVLLIAGYGLN